MGRERRLMGLSALGLLQALSFTVISPILPQYVESFGVSYAEIGYFFTAYSMTWSLLQIYTGHLSDKYGKKRLAALGLLTYGVFAFLVGVASNYVQLVVFRVLQGVGLGVLGPACLGLAAQLEEKGKSVAFYRTANSLGGILGPLLGGLAGLTSLSHPFFLSGIASILAIVPLSYLVEEKAGAASLGFRRSIKEIVLTKDVVLICSAAFLVELCFAALSISIPLLCVSLGLPLVFVGLTLTCYSLGFTLSQIPLGMISERIDRRKLIAFASLGATLCFALLCFSDELVEIAIAMGLLGVTLGTVFVQSTAMVASISPKGAESLYMRFFDSIVDLSFPIIPIPIALLAGIGIKMPFILLGALAASSVPLFLMVKKSEY